MENLRSTSGNAGFSIVIDKKRKMHKLFCVPTLQLPENLSSYSIAGFGDAGDMCKVKQTKKN